MEFDHVTVEPLGIPPDTAEALGIGYAPKGIMKFMYERTAGATYEPTEGATTEPIEGAYVACASAAELVSASAAANAIVVSFMVLLLQFR